MAESRDRFLVTAARLLRERGFAATSIGDVVAASGAPKGSLYFHFPGGKDELAAEAIAASAAETCAAMRAALAADTLESGLDAVFAYLGSELAASDFRAGCPIGTVAGESPLAPRVRQRVAEAFGSWEEVICERLERGGAKRKSAHELAVFVLSAIEGALLLAKAQRSAAPLDVARREVHRLLRAESLS
jgi:TetR/AcrR family transcriptional repressor of lmrAB and yxaGH operons